MEEQNEGDLSKVYKYSNEEVRQVTRLKGLINPLTINFSKQRYKKN